MKARDNQIKHKNWYETVWYNRNYKPVVKHIPIYEELSDVIPEEELAVKHLENIKWIDIKGINTPFYPINNKG